MTTTVEKTPYAIGRDNVQFLGLDVHNPVFLVSSLTVVAFVVGVLAFRDAAADAFPALYDWLTATFDWVFLSTGNLFVFDWAGDGLQLTSAATSSTTVSKRSPIVSTKSGCR